MSNAPSCPACGGRRWDLWHVVRGLDQQSHRYGRCAACGLGHLLTAPDADRLREWYDEGYFVGGGARGGYRDYAADAAAHRANARARMDRVEAAAGPARSAHSARPVFLDIGCATGETLDEARARGWSTYGVELSEWAADRARTKGHHVVATWDQLPDEARELTAVGVFQVLEHLPDPAGVLAELAARLMPGGVLVCETWDAQSRLAARFGSRWQQLSAPSVLWLLGEWPARRLVQQAGLRPESWRPSSKQVGVLTVLGQLAGRLPGPLPDALVARMPVRLGSVRLTYRGEDLVTFVARRPASFGPSRPS